MAKIGILGADWPGIVGAEDKAMKAASRREMLDAICGAKLQDGTTFDGSSLILLPYDPKAERDVLGDLALGASSDQINAAADELGVRKIKAGPLVSPSWGDPCCPFGDKSQQIAFTRAFRQSCEIGVALKERGVRTSNIIRLDTGTNRLNALASSAGAFLRAVKTFRECAYIARDHDQRLAFEPEPPWTFMGTLFEVLQFLGEIGNEDVVGIQLDTAHAIHLALGTANPAHRILPVEWTPTKPTEAEALAEWTATLDAGWAMLVDRLGSRVIDLHLAQSNGTIYGGGDHPATGRHCAVNDPTGIVELSKVAKMWLCDKSGQPHGRIHDMSFDGCMIGEAQDRHSLVTAVSFWKDVLKALDDARDFCGYTAI